MQYLGTEKYYSNSRDFAINIYRNNNADEIVIEAVEVTNGNNITLSHKGRVPMNGQFNLNPQEYPKYSDEIAAAKNAIIIFSFATL